MALVGVGRNQSHIVGVILYGSSISTVTTVPPRLGLSVSGRCRGVITLAEPRQRMWLVFLPSPSGRKDEPEPQAAALHLFSPSAAPRHSAPRAPVATARPRIMRFGRAGRRHTQSSMHLVGYFPIMQPA